MIPAGRRQAGGSLIAATRVRKIQISLLGAAAVVAIVAAAYWCVRDPGEPAIDATLAAELTIRVTPLVEEKISMDWLSGTTGARRMACAVRPVGTEPASATSVAEAQTVYGWALCETQTAQAAGTRLPVAVHLTPATWVEVPSDGDWSDGRIEKMFPQRLHDDLLSGEMPAGPEAELEAAVQARLRELAAHPVLR
jgi:hypothetical protein